MTKKRRMEVKRKKDLFFFENTKLLSVQHETKKAKHAGTRRSAAEKVASYIDESDSRDIHSLNRLLSFFLLIFYFLSRLKTD